MIKKSIIVLCAAVFVQCNDNFEPYADSDFAGTEQSNIQISDLREMYEINGPTTFTRDYVISGTVTANDLSGNFYKTFIVADQSGAIEVKAGLYDLHTLLPVGRTVNISLRGLTCGSDNLMLQLGLLGSGTGAYETDYIGHRALVDKYVERTGTTGNIPCKYLKIKDLNDRMIGSLVTIDSLLLNRGVPVKWAEGYATDVVAKHGAADSIFVYTSPYADFAAEQTPFALVNITGIVMKRSSSTYRLKIRDLRDVAIIR